MCRRPAALPTGCVFWAEAGGGRPCALCLLRPIFRQRIANPDTPSLSPLQIALVKKAKANPDGSGLVKYT